MSAGLAPAGRRRLARSTSRSPACSPSWPARSCCWRGSCASGFLANFLSRTVLIGFLTGVGIQVACGQLAGMFGYRQEPASGTDRAGRRTGPATSGRRAATTLAVSAARACRDRRSAAAAAREIPWALIAVIGAIVASCRARPRRRTASPPSARCPAACPRPRLAEHPVERLRQAAAATAVSIFVVILAQSAATSRAYAAKFDDDFDENVDLVGLGAANLAAGLTGTFVVNGSPTKTAMVDEAGGRSQLAQLTTAAIVAPRPAVPHRAR